MRRRSAQCQLLLLNCMRSRHSDVAFGTKVSEIEHLDRILYGQRSPMQSASMLWTFLAEVPANDQDAESERGFLASFVLWFLTSERTVLLTSSRFEIEEIACKQCTRRAE